MALNHPSSDTLHLYWGGRPVCAVAGIAPVNSLGWVSAELAAHYEGVWGGTFSPGTFPKELADAWVWVDEQGDENEGDWPEEDVFDGWSMLLPDGTSRVIVLGHLDFVRGRVYWRWH